MYVYAFLFANIRMPKTLFPTKRLNARSDYSNNTNSVSLSCMPWCSKRRTWHFKKLKGKIFELNFIALHKISMKEKMRDGNSCA